MTLGRGFGALRIVILAVITVGLVTAVFVVGTRGDRSLPAESPSETIEAAPSPSSPERSQGTEPSQPDGGDDGVETAAPDAAEPVGTRLRGPRAARMERWQPPVAFDGTPNMVAARSILLDAAVRAVALEASQGLDAVAVRVAHRRWEELATGATAQVPRIVWEPVQRAITATGELQWIYAVETEPPAEYILGYEDERLLLRLYGSGEIVHDVEVEALASP